MDPRIIRIMLDLLLRRVVACNLVEENRQEITPEGATFAFPIQPFEIKTFRVC